MTNLLKWVPGSSLVTAAVLACLSVAAGGEETGRADAMVPGSGALSMVKSWVYQLQDIDIAAMQTLNSDVFVIDYSFDGSIDRELTQNDVKALQTGPGGQRRLVLAYMSLGEAEDYRFYWQDAWASQAPSWLKAENSDWAGNYQVRFWDPDWQHIMFGRKGAYLDRIIAAGFDGVYLDRVDAYEISDVHMPLRDRKLAMAEMVKSLSHYAKAEHPGFLIFAQNGEELLQAIGYAEAIDGMGKEDLFFGIESDALANDAQEIEHSRNLLKQLIDSGKPVLLVEYLKLQADIDVATVGARQLGAILFITKRDLGNGYAVD